MSTPDDLTARLDDLLLDIRSEMGRHLGIEGSDDEGLDYLSDLIAAVTPLLERETNRIDALSADVARLTAEVKQAGDLAAYRNDVAVAAGRKADEARARVAERDATIERLRDAIETVHAPMEQEVEVWADGPGECYHDEFLCTDDPAACRGHLKIIQVCQECGYDHDDGNPVLREWPCPTLRVLADTAPTPEVPDV